MSAIGGKADISQFQSLMSAFDPKPTSLTRLNVRKSARFDITDRALRQTQTVSNTKQTGAARHRAG